VGIEMKIVHKAETMMLVPSHRGWHQESTGRSRECAAGLIPATRKIG
jgi:hypothetical protein